MKDQLSKLLAPSTDGAYADIRRDERDILEIKASAAGLDSGRHGVAGYNLRELRRGAWRSVPFTDGQAYLNAKKPVPPAAEPHPGLQWLPGKLERRVVPEGDGLLSQTDEQSKVQLVCDLVKQIVAVPGLANFEIHYREEISRKYFLSSRERYIDQHEEKALCIVKAFIDTKTGLRQGVEVLNSAGRFDQLLGYQARVERFLRELSEPVTPCPFLSEPLDLICEPQLAGSLIHEAVGHTLEADFSWESDRLRREARVGTDLENPLVTVIDDAGVPDKTGTYAFDDEGVAAQRTVLVRHGVIENRLCGLKESLAHDTPSTGNGRAVSYRHQPIVRMSNLYLEAGESSLEDMIADTEKGLLVSGLSGGRHYGDRFLYQVNGAHIVAGGKLGGQAGTLFIESDPLDFVRHIDRVGQRLHDGPSAFCVKGGQPFLPLWNGSPWLRVRQRRVRETGPTQAP